MIMRMSPNPTGKHGTRSNGFSNIMDGIKMPAKRNPKPLRVQCSYTAWVINAYRQCEEDADHDGPHGCTYKGDEWVTFE
jgi:hypothetical protein